jgi:hypothetical protein
MLIFPDDTKSYVTSELAENGFKIIGNCSSKLNPQKSKLLANKKRKFKEEDAGQEHTLLVELSS